jgi:hypothetical protein
MTILILLWLALALLSGAGYVSNIVWIFHHFSAAFSIETLVALVGVLAAPLGIMHGIWTWF